MKARVFVTLKSTVLDPQGQTIRSALVDLGHKAITDVRQSKHFEISLSSDLTRAQAEQEVDTIAREVLTNPVIEEYRIEFTA